VQIPPVDYPGSSATWTINTNNLGYNSCADGGYFGGASSGSAPGSHSGAGVVGYRIARGSRFSAVDCGGTGSSSFTILPDTGILIQAILSDGGTIDVFSSIESTVRVNAPEDSVGGWFSAFTMQSVSGFSAS
jgi:hypothetical protein